MTSLSIWKVRLSIGLFAVAVVVYFLTNACNALFFGEQFVVLENVVSTVPATASQQNTSFSSFKVIEQRNLLKAKNEAPVLTVESQHALFSGASAVSQRGFKLLGTILGNSPAQQYAIVLVKNQQLLYKVGQAVDGWKILAVKRREVLLERNGVKERLLIDDVSKDIADDRNAEHVISRSAVKNAVGNLETIARNIQLAPRTTGGTKGLHVSFVRSNSFFYTIGLRKDDMLLEVNGKGLMSFRDPMSLLAVLDKKMIALDIIRKGKHRTLMYRLVN